MVIDKEELNKFLYYMSFFEHAKELKDLNMYSRSLKAPAYNDFAGIKRRLSTVLLKSLRSEELFAHGKDLEANNQKVSILSVGRNRSTTRSSLLEDYMRFKIKLRASVFFNDIFRLSDSNEFSLIVLDNVDHKKLLLKSILPFEDIDFDENGTTTDARFYNYMYNNYEVCFAKDVLSRNIYDSASSRFRSAIGRVNTENEGYEISAHENLQFRDCIKNNPYFYSSNGARIHFANFFQ